MLDHKAACVLTRTNCNNSSAERLVTLAVYRNNWAVHDDTTALVIDFLPDSSQEFPQICKAIKKNKKKNPFLACLCAAHVNDEDVEANSASTLVTVAEVDCASEEPDTILTSMHKCNSNSTSLTERSLSMES